MKKYISLLVVLIILLFCSNLFAGYLYVEIWNATGYEMNDCCIYLNISEEVSGATWQPGFTPYVFEVDDPSSVYVWAFCYADCYGWEFYANGDDYSYWNPNTQHWEASVEVNGVYNPSQINFTITVNNEIDEASNCSLIRNPNTNPETLFVNQTISTGTTTYTEYEIYVDDELMVEGDVDGFYSGQVYDVSDLEVVDYNFNSSTYVLDIYAELDLEYDDTPPDYDYNVTSLSSSGWNWVSFPVLDPDYDDPIDYVLEPILDDLDEVVHDQDYIYWTGTSWQNNIGDFQSIDGYKIQMDDDAELEVAGWVEDPDTEIPLYEEEENWIGYFIPYSHHLHGHLEMPGNI